MPGRAKILLIYTGGTIGMMQDIDGSLKPFDFKNLTEQVPELKKFDIELSSHSFSKPIDSSNMKPEIWVELVEIIEKKYDQYNGFVILHGSDTMAFTASALSFMLKGLSKPVILTGSQLPIGIIRTDGKENLITAIEIAAATKNGTPIVPEVAIYFEYELFRGNRTNKFNAEHFDAFHSPNYPVLAEAGVDIRYNHSAINKFKKGTLSTSKALDNNIAILKLFPGISEAVIKAILGTKGLKAVVLETFGSGNASTDEWFIKLLSEAISREILILNVTQCSGGSVKQGKYQTSKRLAAIGVIGGADITTEAAVTKLMYLLGKGYSNKEVKENLLISLCGEITVE